MYFNVFTVFYSSRAPRRGPLVERLSIEEVILSFSHSRSRLLEEEEAAKAFQVRKKEAEEREKQRLEEERKKKEAEEKATIDRITLEAGNNVAYVI